MIYWIFYDTKGEDDKRKDFAEKMIETYPNYENVLDRYLEDDFKPADYYIGKSNDDPKKTGKTG